MVNQNAILFVVAAPSGAGKTSLLKALKKINNRVSISISHTTRQSREGEVEGKDYFFESEKKFKDLIKENYFLEYARVFDNYYGTSRGHIESILKSGSNIILEIDWQGAQKVRASGINTMGIFILPPNYKTLKERLISRQKDSVETIKRRMDAAFSEISHYNEFDFILVNDEFEQTVIKLNEIITSPRAGLHKKTSLHDDFISELMAQRE